jgi:hypothetical protein
MTIYIFLVILCFIPILSIKLSQAWRLWDENKVLNLMDPTLHVFCSADQFVKCVHIGLLCVQDDPNDRPTISNVVTLLDCEIGTLPTPKQPTFDVPVDQTFDINYGTRRYGAYLKNLLKYS